MTPEGSTFPDLRQAGDSEEGEEGEEEEEEDGESEQRDVGPTMSRRASLLAKNSMDTADIRRRLETAKEQSRQRRWRISGPTLVLGVLLMPTSFIIWALARWGSVIRLFGNIGAPAGCICALLAVLPSDRRIIFLVAKVVIVVLLAIVGWNIWGISTCAMLVQAGTCLWSDMRVNCSVVLAQMCIGIYLCLGLCGCVAYIAYCYVKGPMRTFRSLWLACGLAPALTGTAQVGVAIIGLAVTPFSADDVVSMIGGAGDIAIGLSVLWFKKLRERVQDWLASRGESLATAAGIAEFVGGCRVEDLVEEARDTFVFISADRVAREEMANNRPNAELLKKAQKARFGQVDAFLSHSWHDDTDDKWSALQAWREQFKAAIGREPRLWIDKYCIDQNNLTKSLRCLPVYLAACNNLVALVGKTYFLRLWCLIEIFVFIEMGGSPAGLDMIALYPGRELEIDPLQAVCSTDEDTSRLRGVLEAGLSGVEGFVEIVRNALRPSAGTDLQQGGLVHMVTTATLPREL